MPDIAPLAAEIRIVLNRLMRRLRQQQMADDLTMSQLSVLSLLRRAGSMTAGDLASREMVRPPSMTRLIAALEADGLIERRNHPSDGRQVLVALTEAGGSRADFEAAAREKWLSQQLVTNTTAEEREIVKKALVVLRRIAES